MEPIYSDDLSHSVNNYLSNDNTTQTKKGDEFLTRLGSDETNFKSPRIGNDHSYSTEKSNKEGKKVSLYYKLEE